MIMQQEAMMVERLDMEHEDRARLQTFKRSFEQILRGDDPWLPLGNFMHQFFGYYKHLRSELVNEAIEVAEDCVPELFQWAVFCAASVEYLCQKYEIPCPTWALNSRYVLEEPWYYDVNADLPEVQEELRQITPRAFTKRNIFCGDRTYRNKYEYEGRRGRVNSA